MTPGPTRPPSAWIDRWGIAGLLVVTAGLYAGVVTHPFDYDDVHSLVENRAVHGLGSFGSLWTSPTAVSADGSTGYRPVLLSVWAIQYAMFGADPSGYHLVNLLLHLGVIILTWRLGAVAFGRRAALIAAALVALHPLHTESVNYITAQSSLLVTFGMTAALLLTTEASRREGRGRLIWSCAAWAAGALAMGAKEVGVVLAVLVVLWEWFREGTRLPSGRSVRRALPFAVAALAFVLVRQWVLGGEGWRGAASPEPIVVLATMTHIIALSLGAWFWPVGLSVDHGDVLVPASFAWMWVAGAAGAVAAAAMFALRGVRTPLLALAWTAVSLAPLGAVVLITRVALFQEHRVYPAGVGLALLVAPLISGRLRRLEGTRRQWPFAVAVVAALVVSADAIRDRTEQWGDRLALWSDAVARYPDSLQARHGLVAACLATGAVDRAESLLRETVRLHPGDHQTLFALADLLMKTGRWEEGQALNQRIVEAQIGRSGMALLEGDMLASRGRWEAAALAYRQAEAAGGRGAELDVRLGAVAERLGDVAEAERRYRRAADDTAGGQTPSMWRQRALDGLAKLGAER